MTSNQPNRPAGYRGTLPAREDRLARPWLIIVGAIFVGIFLLSILGVPSRFIPDPTPIPIPTAAPPISSPTDGSPSPTLEESPAPSPTEE